MMEEKYSASVIYHTTPSENGNGEAIQFIKIQKIRNGHCFRIEGLYDALKGGRTFVRGGGGGVGERAGPGGGLRARLRQILSPDHRRLAEIKCEIHCPSG